MGEDKFELRNLGFIENKDQRPEEIERRVNHLLSLGFSQEEVEKLRMIQSTLHCANEAEECIKNLQRHGFSDPTELITAAPSITSCSFESMDAKINGLKQRGFSNPIKMIKTSPQILGLGLENIDAKINGLKQRGFSDPIKMITTLPSISGLSFENIDAKINGLKQRGFSNPIKMIKTSPQILGLGLENIDAKINGLKRRGFSDPVKMITTFPFLVGVSFENIDAKIEGLKQRGFSDPTGLTTTRPSIFGYSFKNIDKKLDFTNRVGALLELKEAGIQLAESFPIFLTYKFDKIVLTLRVLREYPDALSSLRAYTVSSLLRFNIEDVLVAFSQRKKGESYSNFTKRLREVKKQKLSKEEKQKIITTELEELQKIGDRYREAYMEKNNEEVI